MTNACPPFDRPGILATWIGAAASVLVSASYGQPVQPPAGGPAVANTAQRGGPVNPQSLSCNDLKAELKNAGSLTILSGPKGAWGDTFYGPAVPRCEFWQMPLFTYVRARDGRCGVGYICVDKFSID